MEPRVYVFPIVDSEDGPNIVDTLTEEQCKELVRANSTSFSQTSVYTLSQFQNQFNYACNIPLSSDVYYIKIFF